MTVTILELRDGVAMQGLAAYLAVIVLANLIQGLVILPLWLLSNGIRPLQTLRGMLPALSVAFFSKSSSGTLPITMETAEKNIGVDPKISRAIFPLCTTINMNGCAAFIFVTVIYLMQNNGMPITMPLMLGWIIISTIAAIGNAGIPMGCFFLSASLLASLNVPISILGLILPLYSLIDMLETALNVWSDSCVVKVVDHKEKAHSTVAIDVVGADI
jgi:Na+/H+-dicarboxylate symporter